MPLTHIHSTFSRQVKDIVGISPNHFVSAIHADNDTDGLYLTTQNERNTTLKLRKASWASGVPSDHPLSGVFEPLHFPNENYIMWLGNMIIEALMILECGYRKVSEMTANTESKSFKRYFRDEDLQQVTFIFEDIMETMGFMWGFASDPDYKPGECNQRPWLLPIKLYYQYSRIQQASECERDGWMGK